MSQTEGGPDPHQGGRPSVLSLNIREKSALYAAYIPQLKNGGIFIPTARAHQLRGHEAYPHVLSAGQLVVEVKTVGELSLVGA
jgi:type IV pilus assembly protein PilZ